MSNLYCRVSYGAGTTIVDGKVEKLPKELEESTKRGFNIQVFGDVINPKKAMSPFFKCRNLVAVIGCEYIGTGRDSKSVRAAHVSEACHKVDSLSGEIQDLVMLNNFTYDSSSKELSEVLKYLYEIIVNETKKTFNSSDNITIYWDLNDEEIEMIKNQKEWSNPVYMDADEFITITRK